MRPRQTEPPDDGRARSAEGQAIDLLLAERGAGRYALFLTQREGTILPVGLEAVSGFVLDDRGRVHGFWLAWDEDRQTLTLEPYYPVKDPSREFADDAEYQAARRALGLR
jgi:hypothetical protein